MLQRDVESRCFSGAAQCLHMDSMIRAACSSAAIGTPSKARTGMRTPSPKSACLRATHSPTGATRWRAGWPARFRVKVLHEGSSFPPTPACLKKTNRASLSFAVAGASNVKPTAVGRLRSLAFASESVCQPAWQHAAASVILARIIANGPVSPAGSPRVRVCLTPGQSRHRALQLSR